MTYFVLTGLFSVSFSAIFTWYPVLWPPELFDVNTINILHTLMSIFMSGSLIFFLHMCPHVTILSTSSLILPQNSYLAFKIHTCATVCFKWDFLWWHCVSKINWFFIYVFTALWAHSVFQDVIPSCLNYIVCIGLAKPWASWVQG